MLKIYHVASSWPGACQWLKTFLADLLRMKFSLSLSQEHRQQELENTLFGEEKFYLSSSVVVPWLALLIRAGNLLQQYRAWLDPQLEQTSQTSPLAQLSRGFGTWEPWCWGGLNKSGAGSQLKGAALTSSGLGWRGNCWNLLSTAPKPLATAPLVAVDRREPQHMVSQIPKCLESNAVLGKRFGAACRRMQCLAPSLFGN